MFLYPFLGDLRLPTRQVTGVTRAPNAPGANSTPQDNCLSICRRRAARGTGHLQRMRRRGKYSGAELNNANKSGRPRGDERAVATPTRSTPPASLPRKTSAGVKNTLSILGYYTILKSYLGAGFAWERSTGYTMLGSRAHWPPQQRTPTSSLHRAAADRFRFAIERRTLTMFNTAFNILGGEAGDQRSHSSYRAHVCSLHLPV